MPHLRDLKLDVQVERRDADIELQFRGRATFVSLPALTRILDNLPDGGHIRLNVAGLAQIDHTCAEVLADWIQRRRKTGTRLALAGMSEMHASHPHRRLAEVANA